jgi:hypothetical protein
LENVNDQQNISVADLKKGSRVHILVFVLGAYLAVTHHVWLIKLTSREIPCRGC